MVEEVRLDSKGRIVIPERLRRKAGLRSGSRVKIRLVHGAIVGTKSVEPK